ncbi:hypothetical protein HYY75_00825 [bacterium]|nr:hypothetical protein [bacterium]
MNNRTGTNLLEMLVTVAIIVILASALIGYYMDVLQESREAVVKTNVGKVREALSRYFKDNLAFPTALASLQPVYILENPRELLINPLQTSSCVVMIQVPGTTTPGIVISSNAYQATQTFWVDYDFDNPSNNASQIRDIRVKIKDITQPW